MRGIYPHERKIRPNALGRPPKTLVADAFRQTVRQLQFIQQRNIHLGTRHTVWYIDDLPRRFIHGHLASESVLLFLARIQPVGVIFGAQAWPARLKGVDDDRQFGVSRSRTSRLRRRFYLHLPTTFTCIRVYPDFVGANQR